MPEDKWTEHYEKHDLLRLDCSRYIWPKLSFIRKCASLNNYGEENKILQNKNKNIQLLNKNNTDYDSRTKSTVKHFPEKSDGSHNKENHKNTKISAEISKCETIEEDSLFDKHRNNQEKSLQNRQLSVEKRPRKSAQNVLYSDDELKEYSSDEDDNGTSLFFKVSMES